MINKISDKCISCGPAFQPHTTRHIVAQYNANNVQNKKVEPIDWKPKPPIDQYFYQYKSNYGGPEIKFTEPISTYQQQHLSDYLISMKTILLDMTLQ